VRFVVELKSGKPTVRLESVLRVVEAPGVELKLRGLPTDSEGGGSDA